FLWAIRWDDRRDGKADYFFRGIPVKMFGAFVPARNNAAQVRADNRIVTRFDDGGQALHHFGAALALRNVVGDPDKESRAIDPRFADRKIHGKGGAILAATNDLASDADDVPLAGFPIM